MAKSLWEKPEYQPPQPAPSETDEPPEPLADKDPYVAFGTAANDPVRIRIINEHRIVSQPRYVFMDDQILVNHQWLALVFTQYALILHGRNLDALLDALHDEKVSWIECFHTDKHLLPMDKSAAVVVSITRYSRERFLPLLEEVEEKQTSGQLL